MDLIRGWSSDSPVKILQRYTWGEGSGCGLDARGRKMKLCGCAASGTAPQVAQRIWLQVLPDGTFERSPRKQNFQIVFYCSRNCLRILRRFFGIPENEFISTSIFNKILEFRSWILQNSDENRENEER